MKINWKQKLTSRKFWTAMIGFITSIMIVLKIDSITQEQVVGLLGSMSVLVAYIIGEGLVDANRGK